MGGASAQSISLVCPALEKYVATMLQERSSILKERRKAREEKLPQVSDQTASPAGGGNRRKKKGGKGGEKGDG